MINTLPMVRKEFPDYEPERHFTASLPLDHLRITVQVLEKHPLPLISQYILRAIALEVTTASGIAHLLGLEERDLKSYGADLLKAGLIEQGAVAGSGERQLSLTKAGEHFAIEQAKLSVLKKRTFHFHYNRLSQQLVPLERDVVPLELFRRDDTLFVLPTRGHCPELDDIPIESVRDAIALDTRQRDQFEVVSLLDMQKPYAEYLRGYDVYVLRHRETDERRFAVFRNGRYLQVESAAMQRLQDEGAQVVPDDADSLVAEPIDVRGVLDPVLATQTQDILEHDRALADVASDIHAKEIVWTATQSKQERDELEAEISRLKADLQRIQDERTILIEHVQRSMDNAPVFLSTEEHRPLLMRALLEATKRVIIISPWLNTVAVDDELCQLMGSALARGVHLHIGYGIGQANTGPDAERQRRKNQAAINKIEQHARKAQQGALEIVNVLETHEKILICDTAFGVATSFNWLSYRGEVDAGYRRETGVLLRDHESVRRLIRRAADAFEAASAGRGTPVTAAKQRT